MRTSTSISVRGLAALALIGILIAIGCSGSGVGPEPIPDYRTDGALVIDPNLDASDTSVQAAVFLDEDQNVSKTGIISWAQRQLTLVSSFAGLDSVHSLVSDSTYEYPNTIQPYLIIDQSVQLVNTAFPVADTFSIVSVVPANHQITGNGQVSLVWTGSRQAEAFVMATVKADEAYTGEGYSLYAAGGNQTIPPQAFLKPGTIEPDTGLYNVYVYATTGSPDSVAASALLPAPLPSPVGDPDNIAAKNIAGSFGTVVVTLLDTIRVVTAVQ